MLKDMLEKEVKVELEHIDTYKCRFMGEVNTYDITLVDKDYTYTKSILDKTYGGASILPIDKDGNIFLEIQYRFAIREPILELPAGRSEEGETFLQCAERELKEETGCTTDKIIEMPVLLAQPEFTNEKIGCFIALDSEKTAEQKLDPDESVTVQKVPFELAVELVKRNVIIDERTIIAIGETRCIQGFRADKPQVDIEEYVKNIKEKIHTEGMLLEEKDVDIDYTELCEFGVIRDHIVKVPGNKNSRRECFYLKSGNIVLPISKNGKIGFEVRYMPSVEKNLIQLPCKLEFDKQSKFEDFGYIVTAVGYSNDRQDMYLLKDLEETNEFVWLTYEEIMEYIKEGYITDGRVLAIIFKYFC